MARIDLPALAGEGAFVTFDVEADDVPEQFWVYLEWVGLGSQRVITHYLEGNAGSA